MSRDFDALLEEVLARLEGGESVDSLLARYPEEAHALAPLLSAADRCRQALAFTEPPSPQALAAGRHRLLAEAARRRAAPARWFSLPLWPRLSPLPRLAPALAVLLLVVLVGGWTSMAAAYSLPGDPLYPVKLTSEQARLALTFDPARRAELAVRFVERRRQEAQIIAALGRQASVRFQGRLESFGPQTWTVGGLIINLDEKTQVEGAPALGATVEVRAWSPGDGTLRARFLRIIAPPPATATPTPSPTGTATPTVRPEPTATPTPQRATPSPTASPSPTRIIRPSSNPTSRPTTTPTATPTRREHHRSPHTPDRPTEERGMPSSPSPTATPAGIGMPTATATPEHGMRPTAPAHTPGPHRTPGPRKTPGPPQETPTPQPTEAPTPPLEPTDTPTPSHHHGPRRTPGPHHGRASSS